ncbi:predicted protein [Chaetomium globosum CBS 148.51]|uniref:Uncharacterized protein n=1 Tax=Chaetomium globosum (strain ATCC 6205 / CBS 148.51 / DSM 1962 / NBRC 6347 / NRRL 1970) TaxID=306901 RepID=Q2GVV0_CHAGB|nr:uncharacterized protein CHGG_07904 [Chaetomium globosum CBS 148.51]EAQ86651.1 predicted protein [Chaetomium globosum CBS 148.51]
MLEAELKAAPVQARRVSEQTDAGVWRFKWRDSPGRLETGNRPGGSVLPTPPESTQSDKASSLAGAFAQTGEVQKVG